MIVITQRTLHVIVVNLDDEDEDIRSPVGTGQEDLADHDVVLRLRHKAQRVRLREPRL
jgi:hypothetical protein